MLIFDKEESNYITIETVDVQKCCDKQHIINGDIAGLTEYIVKIVFTTH